ncbi:MAG: L,D-transpeptidase [Candidatus Woesearchaeota archaeon]|jgi:lipoprotein-anchoring transpeptidase ErfK/SrfK|nr:L,D-transpeptidase [Candidatus Woesearchaeota archaeon]
MANRNVSALMAIALALGMVSCKREEADLKDIPSGPEAEQTAPKQVNRSNLDDRLDQELQQNLYPYLDSHGRTYSTVLVVSGKEQEVHVGSYSDGRFSVQATYEVSTGRKGFGNKADSKKTPHGLLRVYGKTGKGPQYTAQKGEEFEDWKFRGTIRKIYKRSRLFPNDEIARVLTRMIWLEGLTGSNKNTRDRSIYFHGTNFEGSLGTPLSGGCIRMRNDDIIGLYDRVRRGTIVYISGVN